MSRNLRHLLTNYGMAVVLLFLCIYYSVATLQRHFPTGKAAGNQVANRILSSAKPKYMLIVRGAKQDDGEFMAALHDRLHNSGILITDLNGAQPQDVRQFLSSGKRPDVIVATSEPSVWLPSVLERIPAAKDISIVAPEAHLFPTFLQKDNLLNIANQIVVIAIIAVGMTMVIITGGIDLSVGSLVALSAVVTGLLIRDHAGGTAATTFGLTLSS